MSPKYYPYRIVFKVGGCEHEWIRYGVDKAKMEDLTKRALELIYRGAAELVSVERDTRERIRI